MTELVLLKLGGSLITDKSLPYAPRFDKLNQLATEISSALRNLPDLSLVLGHGSGSFGHTAAKEYRTRDGAPPASPPSARNSAQKGGTEGGYWHGFAEVWFQASELNRFVVNALHAVEIDSIALAPVAAVSAHNGQVAAWDLAPLKAALAAGLLPVVYGDVIFDHARGGTILSTEDLFVHLARSLRPRRILLAGLEGAVWADFPARTQRVETITPASFERIKSNVGASHGADVTGGMESKVRQMLDLAQELPGLTVQIFSGEQPGNLARALAGESLGTLISAAE